MSCSTAIAPSALRSAIAGATAGSQRERHVHPAQLLKVTATTTCATNALQPAVRLQVAHNSPAAGRTARARAASLFTGVICVHTKPKCRQPPRLRLHPCGASLERRSAAPAQVHSCEGGRPHGVALCGPARIRVRNALTSPARALPPPLPQTRRRCATCVWSRRVSPTAPRKSRRTRCACARRASRWNDFFIREEEPLPLWGCPGARRRARGTRAGERTEITAALVPWRAGTGGADTARAQGAQWGGVTWEGQPALGRGSTRRRARIRAHREMRETKGVRRFSQGQRAQARRGGQGRPRARPAQRWGEEGGRPRRREAGAQTRRRTSRPPRHPPPLGSSRTRRP